MIRKVKVFKAGAIDSETLQPAKELDYVGEFHGFQQQTEFTAIGMVVSPVAIVEKPGGEVKIVPLQNLQFVKGLPLNVTLDSAAYVYSESGWEARP